jgi:DNA-binding CsgD family transcriptional regulator
VQDGRERIWSFAERCAAATSMDALASIFLDEVGRLGFQHVALCSHVDPLKPPPGAVTIFRYPPDWLAYFSEQKFDQIDPVFMEANRRSTPFMWDEQSFRDTLTDAQRRILKEGAEAGLARGFTVPIKIPGALPASCSLVAEGDVDPLSYPAAHSFAMFAHENARRLIGEEVARSPQGLTERERRCLTFVARGKSDWAISKLMGVSESTVHVAVESAKKRFGVATRVQAVVRALLSGQLNLDDIAD